MPDDLRDLGRTVDLHRRASGRSLITVLLGLGLVVAAVGARTSDALDADLATTLSAPESRSDAAGAVQLAPDPAGDVVTLTEEAGLVTPLLGRVGDLLLHVPAAATVLVSYHEAAYAEANPITPVGRLTDNGNTTRFADPGTDDAGGDYEIQVSRGRANAATSAVDVVLANEEAVLAPVAGTVVEVRQYQLYGAYDDVRLELRPDDAPDLAVVLIHVRDVTVAEGDRVEVGDVLAGGARAFPFEAVVDRATAPERFGHVHIEVKQPEVG